jgi:SAM-dependent methyltransferase
LDAGCGDARFLKLLQDRGFEQLYGADYSHRAIEFGKLMLPTVQLTEASISHLPYPDQFFDVIFLIETLEHIPPEEIAPIRQELKRLLKPQGQLIITVPSTAEPVAEKHYQHFSPDLLRSTIEPDFEVKEIIGQDYVPFHLFKLLDKLIDNGLWEIKPLKRWYNTEFWLQHFNRCAAQDGRRLICRAQTKEAV